MSAGTACAIIPALNEAKRVSKVIQAAIDSGVFTEVVVVDDGSTDGTANAAQQAGARVVCHERNSGKAIAMRTGLEATTTPVVCFLDADLLGITVDHLRSLVEPVLIGEAAAVLAIFAGGRAATTLAQGVAPMISGQRCLQRELLDSFAGWASGFGVETAINAHLARLGITQRIVKWHGASHVMKEEKRGLLPGLVARLRMYGDILREWLRSKRR